MLSFFKKPYVIIGSVLILTILLFLIFRGGDETSMQAVLVEKGNVYEEVSVTGKTKALQNVNLAFETSGKIIEANASVGDKVFPGQALVQIDGTESYLNLKEAEAVLSADQASLTRLKKGSRPEDIAIAETKVANASDAYLDAKKSTVETLKDAYSRSDDAVRNNVDQFFDNPRAGFLSINITIPVADQTLKSLVNQGRGTTEILLNSWQNTLTTLSSTSDLSISVTQTKTNLNQVKSFLDNVALAVNALTPTASLSQTTINTYKADVSSARSSVSTALLNTATSEEKLRSASADLLLAKNNLTLTKAGSEPEEILSAEAKVAQDEAKVSRLKHQVSVTVLRSPIVGVVTKQDAKVGEVAVLNTSLVTVMSEGDLEIEASVPEVDIGRIKVQNPVTITLDAFPGETFSGKVSYIEPAETIVDGVVNFKVTIIFDKSDARFKSGLTSNVRIQSQKKEGVLVLPQVAIIENDKGTFVQKLEDGKYVEIPVTLGIRSADSLVEIKDGLLEGDSVLQIGLKTSEN